MRGNGDIVDIVVHQNIGLSSVTVSKKTVAAGNQEFSL
jgi:hypothetical protein